MKFGISSYSFSRLVNIGKMTQLEIVPKIKEMGFDFVEFSKLALPDGVKKDVFAQQLAEACKEANLTVLNYTIGADFLNGSNGDWKAEAERLREELDVAQILGATGMRHDATRGYLPEHIGPRGFQDALPTLIKGCRAVTEVAADMGIRTMIENHGFFCQDSERVEQLMNGVNHPNFGWLVDIGNFVCADEDPNTAIGRAAPYAFHVHAKDFFIRSGERPNPGRGWFQSRGGNHLRGTVIGHGDVPIQTCINILKKAGYTGGLSIEFEGIEPVIEAIEIGLENLRRLAI